VWKKEKGETRGTLPTAQKWIKEETVG